MQIKLIVVAKTLNQDLDEYFKQINACLYKIKQSNH